ncbi:MAG: trigger factor family protein [Pseudomonadota bacterium]
MQVFVETTSAIERKVTITVPAKEVDEAVEKKLHEIKSRGRVDGFRPGKVPFSEVKRRYGQEIRQDVMGRCYERKLYQSASARKHSASGLP